MEEIYTVTTMPYRRQPISPAPKYGTGGWSEKACCREVLVVFWLVFSLSISAQVPETVDLGIIPDSHPVTVRFSVRNPSCSRVVRIDLLSGSFALNLEPDRLVLDPLESAVVQATYRPERYIEKSTWQVLVKSSLAELDNLRILFTAVVPAPGPEIPADSYCDECRKYEVLLGEENRLFVYESSIVLIDLYLDPGHMGYQHYLEQELPRAAQAANRQVRIAELDVREPERLAQLENRLREYGKRVEIIPVAFVGGKVYQGLEAIKLGVRETLKE